MVIMLMPTTMDAVFRRDDGVLLGYIINDDAIGSHDNAKKRTVWNVEIMLDSFMTTRVNVCRHNSNWWMT